MIEIETTSDNKFMFNIKSTSGSILMKSIRFASKNLLNNVINEVISIKDNRSTYERKTNFDGKFLFNVKNGNGELIGQSELYSSEAGMENGIKNLKKSIGFLANKKL